METSMHEKPVFILKQAPADCSSSSEVTLKVMGTIVFAKPRQKHVHNASARYIIKR